MDRPYRYLLYLMIFFLLVSAGGIAPSQTLSRFVWFNDLTSQEPLQRPHIDRLEDGYSVADQHQICDTRQVTYQSICEACLQPSLIDPARADRHYLSAAIPFIQFYPQNLPPPPKPMAILL